jgi:hypothetical protein
MVFKSIPDSGLTVVATCAFITSACFVTQDHLVYIPAVAVSRYRKSGRPIVCAATRPVAREHVNGRTRMPARRSGTVGKG